MLAYLMKFVGKSNMDSPAPSDLERSQRRVEYRIRIKWRISQTNQSFQVISRSQVILVDSFVQDLVASELPLDEDALLEPMADLEDGFVRGSFSVQLELPYYASPSVNVSFLAGYFRCIFKK